MALGLVQPTTRSVQTLDIATLVCLCLLYGCCHGTAAEHVASWPAKPKIFTIWPFTGKNLLTPGLEDLTV